MIHRVVRIGRNDMAGVDSAERIRTVHAAEIDVREVGLRRIGGGHDAGNVEPVGDAHAGETTFDGIAGRNRNTVAVLRVIQQVLLNYTQNSHGVSVSASYPIKRSFARVGVTYGFDISSVVTTTDAAKAYFTYIN